MKKHLIYLLYLVIILSISSCASNISSKYSEKHTEMYAGESAMIYWDFSNADSVAISGVDGTFPPAGNLEVFPEKSTVYYVNAYNAEGQKKTLTWIVNVIGMPISGQILQENLQNDTLKNAQNEPTGIDKVRIVGSSYPKNNNNFSLRFLPIDKHGNYVDDLDIKEAVVAIQSKQLNEKYNTIALERKENLNNVVNFCFCIDNSAAAQKNDIIYKQISSLAESYTLVDNFFISHFNQNFGDFQLIEKDENGLFKPFYENIPLPFGFNSTNKAVGQSINLMNEYSGNNDVVILITQSADNSSLLYDEKDLVEHAQKHNIPIYVIAVGSEFSTYNLAYLASKTGGKLYLLSDDNIDDLQDLLYEIIFSQKSHYSINFTAPISVNQREFAVELLFKEVDTATAKKDTYVFSLKQDKIFSEYQVLAAFNEKNNDITNQYFVAIKNLATTLNDNSTLSIEIIGNADESEGNSNECKKIALARARNIRRKLVEFGANQTQIRISSEGSMRPLYLVPQNEWQKQYNNRAEMRWLLPEELPYEILAETAVSETEAQNIVEIWENYGYKAYYQRVIENYSPAYRVLIWGYATEDAAKKALKAIKRDYKKNFVLK